MVFCKVCGDGRVSNRFECPACKDVSADKKLELMTRHFYDAFHLLEKIRDIDFRGNRHSPQELAQLFCKGYE